MKNKLTIIPVVTLGCLCLSGIALGQNPSKFKPLSHGTAASSPAAKADANAKNPGASAAALSSKDKAFIMAAAKGGMMEVEWGKMASQKSQNADVKKFGSRMVADHTKWNNDLMALASSKGVKVPASKMSGSWKSDKDYMDMMVKDHQKDLAEFQKEAKEGGDADLKKLADKTAKGIEKHLAMAKETQGKVK